MKSLISKLVLLMMILFVFAGCSKAENKILSDLTTEMKKSIIRKEIEIEPKELASVKELSDQEKAKIQDKLDKGRRTIRFGKGAYKVVAVLRSDGLTITIRKGNVQKAKKLLAAFLEKRRDEIRKLVIKFKKIKDINEKRDRHLDFNRNYYNKEGLHLTVDEMNYFLDKDFDALFEKFKKEMYVFFRKDY